MNHLTEGSDLSTLTREQVRRLVFGTEPSQTLVWNVCEEDDNHWAILECDEDYVPIQWQYICRNESTARKLAQQWQAEDAEGKRSVYVILPFRIEFPDIPTHFDARRLTATASVKVEQSTFSIVGGAS